jgi:hypothetical protein
MFGADLAVGPSLVRVIVSRSINAISPHGGLYAMPSLCGRG